MSFYSKKLYQDIALRWGGKSFLYLFMLLALSSLVWSLLLQHYALEAYQSFSTKIIPQIPVITLHDGKINTPEKRPYFIVDAETHKPFAVLDTTGKYTSLEQAQTPILITETQILIQSGPNETKIYKLTEPLNQTINPEAIKKFGDKYIHFLWIFVFPFIFIIFYLYRVLLALFYSLLGKMLCAFFKINLAYGQIVQMMLVAMTPVIIISDLQCILNISIRHEMLLYFLLDISYLFYGILANKDNMTPSLN